MKLYFFLVLALFFSLLVVILPWKNLEKDDKELFEHYQYLRQQNPDLLPVISFNIRLDCEERNQENHFTQRVTRLSDFFNRTSPALVGVTIIQHNNIIIILNIIINSI
jgi:hypothetical protein